MKYQHLKRIQALEAHPRPSTSPADLSTLTDAELEAIIASGDPALTAVVRQLSDAELEALVTLDDAAVDTFIRERMQ